MYMLNRKQRYELIKKLITDTNIPNDSKSLDFPDLTPSRVANPVLLYTYFFVLHTQKPLQNKY